MKRSNTDKAAAFETYWRMIDPYECFRLVPEYPFSKEIGRKHRFDWAFPALRVAVEIEGNAWHVAGGGKHMQARDLEKYNLAASLGWLVFRFSPEMLKADPYGCMEIVNDTLDSRSLNPMWDWTKKGQPK